MTEPVPDSMARFHEYGDDEMRAARNTAREAGLGRNVALLVVARIARVFTRRPCARCGHVPDADPVPDPEPPAVDGPGLARGDRQDATADGWWSE